MLRTAVKGMLPKNKLAARRLTKLKIYAGPEHPHSAQAPQPGGQVVATPAQYQGTGKRKTSVARVILRPGDEHVQRPDTRGVLPRDLHRKMVLAPLKVAGVEGTYDLRVRVHGAARPARPAQCAGIARALVEADPNLRVPLKREGFLTRDARIVERKKAGLHKARKAPQFSARGAAL